MSFCQNTNDIIQLFITANCVAITIGSGGEADFETMVYGET